MISVMKPLHELTIGFDVSTSCTAYTILGADGNIVRIGHFDFSKCETMWQKADRVRTQLNFIVDGFKLASMGQNISPTFRPYVEEALLGFRPGLSSATTISSLIRFNGIVSYIARDACGQDVTFIGATHARKACGIKVLQKHPLKLNAKTQVFEWVSKGPLHNHTWPTKLRSTKLVDWAMDETDSWVIARAGYLSHLAHHGSSPRTV